MHKQRCLRLYGLNTKKDVSRSITKAAAAAAAVAAAAALMYAVIACRGTARI